MATKFITVSIDIMHDKNLNQSQKFILAEIEQLSQLDNGCYASNAHFSDLIGITKENVSRNISELESMGYISIEIKKGSRNHTRIITLTKIVRPPYQNSKTPLLKQQETKENIQDNKPYNKDMIETEFQDLWNGYTLKFLSKQNRKGGIKKNALDCYKKLRQKFEKDKIFEMVRDHAKLKIGHKDLERVLTMPMMEDYLDKIKLDTVDKQNMSKEKVIKILDSDEVIYAV